MNRYLQQDLLAAQIARMYSNEYKEAFFVAIGNYPGADVQSVSGNVRVEIKTESTPIRTGNVAIEFWNTDLNIPSGILSTIANQWLHIVLTSEGYIAVEFDVDILKKLVIEHGVVKSNGRNSLCKIIPLQIFKGLARRIFPFKSQFLEYNIPEGNFGCGEIPNQATPRIGT
jgi:hypothetical protein